LPKIKQFKLLITRPEAPVRLSKIPGRFADNQSDDKAFVDKTICSQDIFPTSHFADKKIR